MDDYHSKLQFLERFLDKSKYSSNTKEAEFFCFFCNHHKKKLSVNLETDHWHCWICGKAGKNLIYLIRRRGTPVDLKEYFNKYKAKDVKVQKFDTEFQLRLPEEFIPIVECKDSVVGKRVFNYLTQVRGVDEIDILRHKLGTAITGEYTDSIIFPSFDKKGYLNFFTGRYADEERKFKNPYVPRGYKNQIILNELNLNWKKPIIVVESFTDMLKTIGNTIPLYGSFLSRHSLLFSEIVKHHSDVILALDVDADEKTNIIATNFIAQGLTCYNIDIKPYLDVGQMAKNEFKLRYENAHLVTKQDVFRSRLRALC